MWNVARQHSNVNVVLPGMKAMILAAGVGTRLRPITDTIPKALARVRGTTMLELVIQRLVRAGVTMIVVNAHHFSDQIYSFVQSRDWGIPVTVVVEDGGLETAGGVANAANLLEDCDPILIHNVDVLSTIDLGGMVSFHNQQLVSATLAVRTPANTRPFLVNDDGRIVGHRNKLTGIESCLPNAGVINEVNFCGVHILSQELLRDLNEHRTDWKGKSLTDYYLSILSDKVIRAFDASDSFWLDIGTPEKLSSANSLEHNIDFLS